MLLVGVVREVRGSDALVALPNNLTGHVEVDEVSDELNGLIEEALEDEEADPPSLSDFLWTGQMVRCVVVSTATVGGKKHIALSLKPSRVNANFSMQSAHEGMAVYGAVSAVEDHGYTVSLGTEEATAFLPLKEGACMGKGGGHPVVGQVIEAIADKVKEAQKLVVLGGEGAGSATKEVEDLNMDSLHPGMLVNCRYHT